MSGCWFLALEAGSWHGRSSSSISIAENSKVKLSNYSFLVGFQKGRSGLRGPYYCEWFRVIFGTKLGGVLLFRVGFEKNVWLFVSCFGGWFMAAGAAAASADASTSITTTRRSSSRCSCNTPAGTARAAAAAPAAAAGTGGPAATSSSSMADQQKSNNTPAGTARTAI